VVARKPSNSVTQNERHGVWVPVFAGTTMIVGRVTSPPRARKPPAVLGG
jgi:hypothetical protein